MLLNGSSLAAESRLFARSDLLLVICVAILAGSLSWLSAEILNPDGALGPAALFNHPGSPSRPMTESDREIDAAQRHPPHDREPLTATASGETPRPRGFLAGETAEMRQRRRQPDNDLRSWFIANTLAMHNPGRGALVAPMTS